MDIEIACPPVASVPVKPISLRIISRFQSQWHGSCLSVAVPLGKIGAECLGPPYVILRLFAQVHRFHSLTAAGISISHGSQAGSQAVHALICSLVPVLCLALLACRLHTPVLLRKFWAYCFVPSAVR